MRGRAASVALPALVVVALVAIVAIAATGSTPGGDDATRPPSQALSDLVFTLGLVGVLLGGVLLLYGLLQRKAIQREVATGRYGRTSLLAYLAFVGAFTAFTSWRMTEWELSAEPPAEGDPAFTEREVVPTLPESAETSYTPSVSWIPVVVVAALLLAGALAWLLSERRARRRRGPSELTLAGRLADALDETLDDLRALRDPRRAIVAAYARLELVLAAHGIPRHAAETSLEYLERVLRDLGLAGEPTGRLTDLFTRAKFSQHEVDLAMKEEAISALEEVRDELRHARDEPVVARDDVPAGAGAPS